jgi:cell division protein FtsZ
MASPLLEAGAIDGARGILINITGSSSLKLSEVNEASTIIQNAAHEDANIIFGAVMDERMGNELKLTVIATGFREEKPARRERMLADATLPTAHQAPVREAVTEPKIVVPPAMAAQPTVRFASEAAAETSSYYEAARQQARQAVPVERVQREEWTPEPEVRTPEVVDHLPAPEPMPVRASVFDDDFFREPKEPMRAAVAAAPTPVIAHVPEPISVPEPVHVAEPVHDMAAATEAEQTLWPEARIPSFAGYAGDAEYSEGTDELDIPAFLRKKH